MICSWVNLLPFISSPPSSSFYRRTLFPTGSVLGGKVTIIFISRNMDIVRELSDRIIVLEGGSVLAHGDVAAVLSSEEVIDAYLGV